MAKKNRSDQANPLTQMEEQSGFKLIITAKNEEQKQMLKIIKENTIIFVKGPPGCGKTFVAVYYALQQIFFHKFDHIVFSRPVVEAGGEKLGFLPGDMFEKIDPYMIPIFDSLLQMVPSEVVKKLTNKNGGDPVIKVLPLAYMRGCTFRNSIIILDESQNTLPEQMRMLLTRIGEGSKMIICGDVMQSDIRQKNGLHDAFERLQDIPGIGFVTLTDSLPRHPLIADIEDRYQHFV